MVTESGLKSQKGVTGMAGGNRHEQFARNVQRHSFAGQDGRTEGHNNTDIIDPYVTHSEQRQAEEK